MLLTGFLSGQQHFRYFLLFLVFRLVFFVGDVFQQDVGTLAIRGQWDVVHIAEAQQRVDIRLVRLHGERVAQEDDEIDLLRRDAGTDLLVAAKRAGHHGLDVETEGLIDQGPGRMRGDEMEFTEQLLVMADEFQHFIFLFIMGYKCDCFHGCFPSFPCHTQYNPFAENRKPGSGRKHLKLVIIWKKL